MSQSKNTSICLIGLDCYPVLSGLPDGHYIGGESVQISLLAMAFRDLGYRVTVITGDYGQPDESQIDGIRVLKAFKEGPGVPVLRFFYRRFYRFLRALRRANSDIYYQSCAGFITGLVAWYCRTNKKRKKFVFRTAHDTDCIQNQQIVTYAWQRKLYEYGLKKADIIAVQGIKQQDLLKKNYGLESVPVNMIVEEPNLGTIPTKDIDILWAANMRHIKRPELAIKLAKMLPKYTFTMIGGPLNSLQSYYEEIEKSTHGVENLNFLGFIPYSEVNTYFSRAKLFINTSEIEGFPNTFLQAWIRQVPVISFFDPDGLIASKGLGVVPANLDEMKENISRFLTDDDRLDRTAKRCKQFVEANYRPLAVARTYEKYMILD